MMRENQTRATEDADLQIVLVDGIVIGAVYKVRKEVVVGMPDGPNGSYYKTTRRSARPISASPCWNYRLRNRVRIPPRLLAPDAAREVAADL